MSLYDGAKKTLKGIVEKEAEEEEQQQEEEEDVDLTPHEHERVLRGAYRSFVMPGTPKIDIDSYFDQDKPHVKTLIKKRLKEMGSGEIIMTLWVTWKKPMERPLIDLGPKDLEEYQGIALYLDDDTSDNYIRVEMPFNGLMTEFFEGSDINNLVERMLAHIKTQTKNPKFPESGFFHWIK